MVKRVLNILFVTKIMKLNICLLIKDDKLLENIVKSAIKSAIVNKKGFDSKPVYNEKYLKTEIKSYEGKISTSFHDDGIPKESSHCICLSVIMIDSVFKIVKNYYAQFFLEDCKYIVKRR